MAGWRGSPEALITHGGGDADVWCRITNHGREVTTIRSYRCGQGSGGEEVQAGRWTMLVRIIGQRDAERWQTSL